MEHTHKWEETPCNDKECEDMTAFCECGAYKLCDGEILEEEIMSEEEQQMKKYNVLVEETLSRTIEVEARDEEHADEIVGKMYDNEEIVLDYNDLSDTVIGGEYTEEVMSEEEQQARHNYLNK